MHKIFALHTPLHEVTVGSGSKLKIQTWPTYPSLLHTHTSLPFSPMVGAAQVNCNPALVFLIGTAVTSSGDGLRSPDIAEKRNNKERISLSKQGVQQVYLIYASRR